MNNQNPTSFNDFISFRKFISLTFIQVLYVIGAIAITIVAVGLLIGFNGSMMPSANYNGNPLAGFSLLIIGNLLWRVICEAWILFFRLASSVSNIENQVKKLSGNSIQFEESLAPNKKEEPAEEDKESWKCPKCGSTNPGNIFMCYNCGYSLDK